MRTTPAETAPDSRPAGTPVRPAPTDINEPNPAAAAPHLPVNELDPARRFGPDRPSKVARVGMGIILGAVAALLTVVIITPVALSSRDLISWAAAPTGLDLDPPWPVLVFLSLDAAAGACVLLTVYCAWRGEPPGAFGLLVWCFAAGSAFANWRHGTTPDAAPDAVWFFPAMSLAGPALLEVALGRFRRWAQRVTGRRPNSTPAFGWRRWTPGLGSFRDTYGAYRTALLLGIDTVESAATAYHRLCPDGSLKIATALRHRHTNQPTLDTVRRATSSPLERGTDLPVDLMRRIPVNTDAYQRWRDVWAEIRPDPAAAGENRIDVAAQQIDLKDVADRHAFSLRQIEFIRRAGQAGLLDSPIPPALRLAALATTADTHPNTATGRNGRADGEGTDDR